MAHPAPPATPCMTAPSLLTAVCPFSLPAVAMASTPSLVFDDGAARPGPFPDRWRAASPHGPVAVRPAPPHGGARSSGGSGPAPVASPVVIVSQVHRRSPYRHRQYGYHVNFNSKMLLQVRADGRLQWWRRLVLSSSNIGDTFVTAR